MIDNYYYYFTGPLILKMKCSNSLFSFLKSCEVKEYNETDRFKHGIVKIKNEYNLLEDDLEIFVKSFQPYIDKYCDVYKNEWALKPCPDSKVNNAWFNFQDKNDFRVPHMHNNCDLSFIIYTSIPDALSKEAQLESNTRNKAGAIVFVNELPTGKEHPYSGINDISYMPEEGDIFIFPSYLTHFVNPFTSDCTRISMAGNIHANT